MLTVHLREPLLPAHLHLPQKLHLRNCWEYLRSVGCNFSPCPALQEQQKRRVSLLNKLQVPAGIDRFPSRSARAQAAYPVDTVVA